MNASAGALPRRRARALMIGPLPRAGTPIGGTQVSFAQLIERMRASDRFDFDVVDTSREVHGGSVLRRAARSARTMATVFGALLRMAKHCDVVVLNMSSGGLLNAGPMLAECSRFLRTPLVVRAFGGCLDESYERLSPWIRRSVDATLLQAPLVLLQTHSLCERFAHVDGARWFPTTRDAPTAVAPLAQRCRKFLFLSQVRSEKGIQEALDASRRLPADCSLTVCGPLLPGFDVTRFEGLPNVTYRGVTDSSDVPRLLAEHDALVFPTWYEGEGIPGVVIETLQAGRPVITTTWRALPEIVVHGSSGWIVPPRDVDALAAAMRGLHADNELYFRLARGARARGLEFDAARWHRRFEHWLAQVVAHEEPTRFGERDSRETPAALPHVFDPEGVPASLPHSPSEAVFERRIERTSP